MQTFKTWKSKLKKCGAAALASFMLCGSFSAFAQGEKITTNEGAHAKTVTGYQTARAVGYRANIEWGDMVFCYDRGIFDPATGKLVGSFKTGEGARADVEIGGSVDTAGYWYGVDGKNNHIKITNYSTDPINVTATAGPREDFFAEGKGLQLYSFDIATGKGWSSLTTTSTTRENLSADDDSYVTPDNVGMGTANGSVTRKFDAATYNANGIIDEAALDTSYLYLNVTGTPPPTFTTTAPTLPNPSDDNLIGAISLSFTNENGDDLTPVTVTGTESPDEGT